MGSNLLISSTGWIITSHLVASCQLHGLAGGPRWGWSSWERETCPLVGVLMLTGACPSPPHSHGLRSGLESTSTTPGGLGGGRLPQAVQGAPSPPASAKVFPAPRTEVPGAFPFQCQALCHGSEGVSPSQRPSSAFVGPSAHQV